MTSTRHPASPVALALALLLGGVFLGPGETHGLEAPLPRHPAPSPDGSRIAFSWQGDLWVVPSEGGTASRLTVHSAADRFPVWSRDGRWIAFASHRHGNADVYVLRVDGSEPPRRLTWASSSDTPVDFTDDGEGVLFVSARGEAPRRTPEVYRVGLEGGTPARALEVLARSVALDPSSDRMALVRGGTPWARQGYRGSADRDVWIREADGILRQLTTFDGDDDHPSWLDSARLVVQSARSGRDNLFVLDAESGDVLEQLTDHRETSVRFPRAADDGLIVAYEVADRIWTVTPDGGVPRPLSIDVPADFASNPVEYRTARSGAGALAVAPDGESFVVEVHGELFATALRTKQEQELAAPPTARLTRTPFRDDSPRWSPDGRSLYFTSDRSGTRDVLRLEAVGDEPWSRNRETRVHEIAASPEHEESSPLPSPDGEHLVFVRDRGDLMIVSAEGGDARLLLPGFAAPDVVWSPDGRWLAVAATDENFNSDVWILSVDGSREPVNVSRHPDDDTAPSWSPDGRRLLWISQRRGDSEDVWGVWLAREDHERSAESWYQTFQEAEKTCKAKAKKARKGAESKAEDDEDVASDAEPQGSEDSPETLVRIDFEGLSERATAVTELYGDEAGILVGDCGRRVAFTAERNGTRDLYSVRWDGSDLQRLTEDSNLQWTSLQLDGDGQTIYYLDAAGRPNRVKIGGGKGDPMPFDARYEVDLREERAVVFSEAWRALDLHFYDPDFHGADWDAVRERYRPWALAASHPADFADIMNLMVGELNASHLAYRPAGDEGGDDTGWIGARFDPDAGGPGLRISEVLPESPADAVGAALEPGERLLAVEGREITAERNVFELLNQTRDRPTHLRVLGTDGEERTVEVRPVGLREIDQLDYREWVRERRALVDELSDGRLGYIHIQGMNIPSFEEFERSLYAAAHGREGLVIDVRSNGGGWTTDYLMAVLTVRRHAFTVPRGTAPTQRAYPQSRLPLAAWTRPAITLCDEESYSNAEIFSWAFQSLERGRLVGTPTFGAVISTGGMRLLDGAWFRIPFRGWYVAGSGVNMENNGAVPDVIIERPPGDDLATDSDVQLEAAVEELLASLETDPRTGSW